MTSKLNTADNLMTIDAGSLLSAAIRFRWNIKSYEALFHD